MKILHAISDIDLRSGGTSATFIKLTAAQARAGLDVTAISTYRQGADLSAAGEMERSGVKVHLLGPAFGPLRWARNMRATLSRLLTNADVAHVHAMWEEIQHQLARQAARMHVPYVMLPQGMLDPWSLSQSALKKRVYMALRARKNLERATAIHVTAEAERELIRPLKLGTPFIVEPLGVDLSEFERLPARGFLRARHPQIGSRPIVLFLSRLHPKKGIDLLLPAFAAADTQNAVLVLAGPVAPDYGSKLEREVASRGLSGRVFFSGMLHGPERIQAYVDADLFVLPSFQENFGIVVVEAGAAGCPVLISDQVNIWPAIREAGAGGVVRACEADLTAALTQWMSDSEARSTAGRRGRDLARTRYDWDVIGRRWSGHYELLKGGRLTR